jgi:hypothetical protein
VMISELNWVKLLIGYLMCDQDNGLMDLRY